VQKKKVRERPMCKELEEQRGERHEMRLEQKEASQA
jgi:hypothetical protein